MTAFPECPACGCIGHWQDDETRPTAECNNPDCKVLTFSGVGQ